MAHPSPVGLLIKSPHQKEAGTGCPWGVEKRLPARCCPGIPPPPKGGVSLVSQDGALDCIGIQRGGRWQHQNREEAGACRRKPFGRNFLLPRVRHSKKGLLAAAPDTPPPPREGCPRPQERPRAPYLSLFAFSHKRRWSRRKILRGGGVIRQHARAHAQWGFPSDSQSAIRIFSPVFTFCVFL